MKKELICFFVLILINFQFVLSDEVIPLDRRTDWSNAGVKGGIPNYPICVNVKDYGAVGDGITDDTQAIVNAISAAGVNCAVYIPEGKYNITSTISINKNNITIQGAGKDKTLIFSELSRAFYIAGSLSNTVYIDVVSAQKGSNIITLADASSINIGDYLVIDQENDPLYISTEAHETDCGWCGYGRCSLDHNTYCHSWNRGQACSDDKGICEGGKRTLGFIVKVVGKNQNNLIIEDELYWTFKPEYDPQIIKISSMREYIGLEDFYITTRDRVGGITFSKYYCSNCWMKGIESYSSNQRHIIDSALYKNEYRENYFHHVTCYIGNYGYGMALQGHVTSTLIENNIFNFLGSPVSFSAGGAGNVVAYNYFGTNYKEYPSCGRYDHAMSGDVQFHGAHPIMHLIEGNYMNRFASDFIHGSASHNTVFRNYFRGHDQDILKSKSTIGISKYSRYFNIVGNILGAYPRVNWNYEIAGITDTYCWRQPNIYVLGYKSHSCSIEGDNYDPLVKETLLRHGNYDYADNEFKWNSSIENQNLPESLYLNQKPLWWGNNLAWPPYGPLTQYENNKIPAQIRFESMEWPVCGNNKVERRQTKIVIDDRYPECTLIGSWIQGSNPNAYENTFTSDGTSSADTDKWAIFTPNIQIPGEYEVYYTWAGVWWLAAQYVPVTVFHGGGSDTLIVNLSNYPDSGGFYLGKFNFSKGTNGRVIINASSPGYTAIDAIRFVQNYEEECDDGNLVDEDGCSSKCKLEINGFRSVPQSIVTIQDMLGAYQNYKRNEVSLLYFLDKLRRWIVFW